MSFLYAKPTRGHGLLEEFLARQRARIGERLIPAGHRSGRILDIGCGSYPLFLANTTFSGKYGLDKMVDEKMAPAFSRARGITLLPYDIALESPLPFGDDYFSVVTMFAVLEHVMPGRVVPLLEEVRRVLAPGGVFILTVPAGWTDKLLRAMAKLGLVSPIEIEDHKDTFSLRKVIDALRRANFREENVRAGRFEMSMNIWATAVKE
ncbi:MAG: class I SAM-dependent methyltransferase [Nitrospirae bacterium]|nr:class I SAM-dependent methyltransferase [Nitrospirota bacterium]